MSMSSSGDNQLIPAISADRIRKVWHNGEWYYSVIDLIAELLESDYKRAQSYWSTLKARLKKEGNETITDCDRLRLKAEDGKMRLTDVVNTEQALRLIQSIPSPKVEPMKLWLASVGAERLEEGEDTEEAVFSVLERAASRYRNQGKSDTWIQARLQGIITRKAFIEALTTAVVEELTSRHYAQATDEIYKGLWQRTAGYLKGELALPLKANLRDHQPELALIYQRIAEAVAAQKLGDATELIWEQAREIVRDVAEMIGEQARTTGRYLNTDLATGKTLLPTGQQEKRT